MKQKRRWPKLIEIDPGRKPLIRIESDDFRFLFYCALFIAGSVVLVCLVELRTTVELIEGLFR